MDDEHLKQQNVNQLTLNDPNNDITSNGKSTTSTSDLNVIPAVIQTKEDYFDALRIWLQQVQLHQAIVQYFPYYLAANYQQTINGTQTPFIPSSSMPNLFSPASFFNQQQQQQNSAINGNAADQNIPQPAQPVFMDNLFQQNQNNFTDNTRRNLEVIQQNGGYEYVIAPIWKRFVAETIDILILFIIKLMAAFMIMDLFDVDLIDLDFDSLKSSLEEDYTDFLMFSSDLLVVEIITKVLVCFYEAMWTAQGQTFVGGATPGKIIMGIRILYVEGVVPIVPQVGAQGINYNNLMQMRALLYPASNPGFRRALLRAIAKNMLMTLMFPMCFVLLFFRNNRTGYDVITKTIVVEENPSPVRRRL